MPSGESVHTMAQPKLLLVEDQPDYRDALAMSLFQKGYRVKTASRGREAIEIGCRFRPQVLIADWILADHLSGLDVSDALRTIVPELQTIMITGYPSRELEAKSGEKGVFRFLAKPFRIEELRTAVGEAVNAAPPGVHGTRLACLEVNSAGTITFANAAARDLFWTSGPALVGTSLASRFQNPIDLDRACADWIEAELAAPASSSCSVTARRDQATGSFLVLAHTEEEERVRRLPFVSKLLDREDPRSSRLLYPLHILIADPDPFARQVGAAGLEAAGAICHVAETVAEAKALFDRDPNITLAILGLDFPDGPLAPFLEVVRAAPRETLLIGNSERDRSGEFADLGVNRFILQPWVVSELIEAMRAE